MNKKYRIGIDIGGTFTDAVIIDNDTYEIVAMKKIPTTHSQGVARGVIDIIAALLKENHISPGDVVFIAHGTTQATNALLEGDVASVGIIGMGTGVDARSARAEAKVERIELAPGRFLKTNYRFIDSRNVNMESITAALDELYAEKSEVIVASEAYGVEDPRHESLVTDIVIRRGGYATAGHEISQLYGLKMRTRTSVVNASLIPKMMETANMTETAVRDTGIPSDLMIMRCDGGVMSVEEMCRRPILTMLSGLAAGVAGALMYEKVSDGIFLEVGGTSIDISVIKNGKVMVKYAQVGGHKTYLRSLDVRTLGIAGGSMIRVKDGKIIDVGPRSAHIAGKLYECFDSSDFSEGSVQYVSPVEGDPAEYAVVTDKTGNQRALTLCGAANILGYVPKGDYAYGDYDHAKSAWKLLADELGVEVDYACRRAIETAVGKIKCVVNELIEEYDIQKELLVFVGGGGSASVITQPLAEAYGCAFKITKNAPYISTIGVALAMVREQLERTIANPTEADVIKIREDAIEAIVRSGAKAETVDVSIEIDAQKNILRAIATGASELRSKEMGTVALSKEQLTNLAAQALLCDPDKTELVYSTGRWNAFRCKKVKKYLFGLIKSNTESICIMDREGVARLRNPDAHMIAFQKGQQATVFTEFVHDYTEFSDANASIPKVFVFFREKMVDLSGMSTAGQLQSILSTESSTLADEEPMIAVAFR